MLDKKETTATTKILKLCEALQGRTKPNKKIKINPEKGGNDYWSKTHTGNCSKCRVS